MDTSLPAGSPREGYPVEIQALWYAALKFLDKHTGRKRWGKLAGQVSESVTKLFVPSGQVGLADCLWADRGTPAQKALLDDTCRPNQLFAVTLGLLENQLQQRGVVQACADLIVPGAIRSLADRPVRLPLPVILDGHLLNDPERPYWGHYRGDENSRRKPAYHNGTAWTWVFPSYCEAVYITWGRQVAEIAMSVLLSSLHPLSAGCVGQMPEIVDGDAPHPQRGCVAQAWGVTEFLRVYRQLADALRTVPEQSTTE